MNSLIIAVCGILALIIGYRFYGNVIEKLWDIDKSRKTPAVAQYDGIDYVPAKHWLILFGHHFSSIAGAGPIIGPVLAVVLWGWFPAFLWLVIGTVFIGAVHDFCSLVASLRNKGKSIADIAETVMGKKVKLFFALFLWMALVLVVAVFAASTATTLVQEPRIVVPTFGLIFLAVFVGFMIYRLKVNLVLSTGIGVAGLVILLIAGFNFPVSVTNLNFWLVVLLVYAFIASTLPVHILLQPRDYLSTFILFFGLGFGYIGLFITRPVMHTPAFISWNTSTGMLWPMMFVFIACGAISGFHSLISSGTTSKQISNEKDAKKIGYGAMVLEGVLALMTLLAVSAGLYWNKETGPAGLVYPELIKSGDWIGTFAAGYGEITKPLLGATFGKLVAIITLNAFVITTLDTATRITRYISEELFGDGLKISVFKNRYFSTLIVIVCAGYLAFGNWKAIWPIFGASNQLVAALVLIVITNYLLSKKKPIKYTVFPAIFMLLTTVYAIVYLTINFFKKENYLLTSIGTILLFLAVFVVIEGIKSFRKYKYEKN
ncbi:MAG: carbon starvation protein A [Elusimicrobia bacterium CG06_land_8_20_14_3_00_38_11]|nr:MAG: carbon starvation protein A [Elusimicrobia bacterium CG06_land_8_20_14_3_00_38_11]